MGDWGFIAGLESWISLFSMMAGLPSNATWKWCLDARRCTFRVASRGDDGFTRIEWKAVNVDRSGRTLTAWNTDDPGGAFSKLALSSAAGA